MKTTSSGVIGLLAVVMIGAVMLAGGITVAFISQTQVVLSGDVDGEHVARMLSTACVEEAVLRLKLDEAYVGGAVPLGSSVCTATVSGSGATRSLTATTTHGVYTKTIVATLTRKANAAANAKGWSITAWTENGPP